MDLTQLPANSCCFMVLAEKYLLLSLTRDKTRFHLVYLNKTDLAVRVGIGLLNKIKQSGCSG